MNIQACGEMSPEKRGEGIDQVYSPIDSPDGLTELVLPARTTQKSGFWGGFREILREEFSGYERTHEALNQGLLRAWNQSNPISWIMARVRCEILHLSPQEYATQMRDLTKSTLAGLEHEREFGRAKYNPEVIHRILQGWERISSERGDAVISLALGEAKHELLKLLTSKHGNTLYGTLCRWRYEVGPERFEAATGLQYKTFWSRGKSLSVTDFSELLGFAEKIGFISSSERAPQCSAKLWSNPRVIELRNAWLSDSKARGRPIEVAKLHLLLSASGLKVDVETLGRGTEFKLQSIVVCSLAHFNLVPWKKIAPAFAALRKLGSLTEEDLAESKQRWQAAYRNRPESFEDRLQTIAKERGLSNAQLADALGLRESYPLKPILPVFRALKYGEYSSLVTSGVLAHLIARSHKELSTLLEQKRSEVAASWRRVGSTITSPIAIEREIWNVSYADLSFSKEDIQRLEWGKSAAVSEAAIVQEVRRLGELRTVQPLSSLNQRQEFLTEWLWAYGDKLAKSGHTLFTRHLFTSIAAQKLSPDVSTQKSTITTEERLLSTFLRGSGLSQIVYRRAVKHARETGRITKEHKQALLEGFGYKAGSPEKIFFECCADSPNMVEAIVRWRKLCATKSDVVQGFHALVDHVRKTEPSRNEEHLAPIVNASVAALVERRAGVIKPAGANSGALRLAALALCGVTRIELLNAADEYAQQERQEQEERAAVKQQQSIDMQKAASWEISPQMIALDFEARISLLAHRMLDKYKVSCDDLFKLFPDYGQPIRVIYNAVMHDTPWFVAALVCYNEPHEALMVMIQELQKGRVPKHAGSDHFKSQQDWIKSRGSLGKLNEGSLKLSFDFPFVRPIQAPEKASTRGRGKPA